MMPATAFLISVETAAYFGAGAVDATLLVLCGGLWYVGVTALLVGSSPDQQSMLCGRGGRGRTPGIPDDRQHAKRNRTNVDADPANWDGIDDAELARRCSRIVRYDVYELVSEYRRTQPTESARRIAIAVTTDALYRFPTLALASA